MTGLVIPMEGISENDRDLIGSKAFSLHGIAEGGFRVPSFICITTEAYKRYLRQSGLKGRILMELSWKEIRDMRWEEMWDASLRIRNMFLNTPIPDGLSMSMREELEVRFTGIPVVVRSSAPGEDSARTSFAGLHESYVNVKGPEAILEHIRLVWASLWSDAALLYREELGLDVMNSSMAVLVQELIAGDVSGIVFSRSPDNSEQMVIEAVHGLNKGLVDGDVEPDRWLVSREDEAHISHSVPSGREKAVRLKDTGTSLERNSDEVAGSIPLDTKGIQMIRDIALVLEKSFGHPQDIEWTIRADEIFVLQSRPVTTSEDSEKLWYLSLRRTMDDLRSLRKRIESELIPEMVRDADTMRSREPAAMDDRELTEDILQRKGIYESWDRRYKDEFIPFAHGMRLFGQVYNDRIRPDDPYEFMELLSGSEMLSIERNKELNRLAGVLRNDASLFSKVKSGVIEGEFREGLEDVFSDFGHSDIFKNREEMLKHIIELASGPAKDAAVIQDRNEGRIEHEERFISAFSEDERNFAEDLLEIARVSYRLRDDDNIHLGRIEQQYLLAVNEGKRRLIARSRDLCTEDDLEVTELIRALNDNAYVPAKRISKEREPLIQDKKERVRQVRGQPAGKGLVTGIARVIRKNEELPDVRSGEILVCDAIDPKMTFVVPLVSGIVERRGGMLIHGAIIAREYGIPCVTGIPDATGIIKNGDTVTVDGFLGIVTIERK